MSESITAPEEDAKSASSQDDSSKGSQAEALKSSSIIGGSTVIVMAIRMIRTKVIAVFLGPAGVGLESIYDSVVSFAKTVFDLGISSSGVRQIASAAGTGDEKVISLTTLTLRRICVLLGAVGAISLFLAREQASRLAFGNEEYAGSIAILSFMLLFAVVTDGQGALLQGMRRIRDLAMVKILGALAGAVVSIPIVVVWGREGIPYYMVSSAAAALLISWSYARRVKIKAVAASAGAIFREASSLMRLGMAFVASALLFTGTQFIIRVMVSRAEGADGVGEFQAANALSMVYVGFILQAMGTDFYPRLTAAADDNSRCNRLVNEQSEISLLLALPGILGTIAFAPWVVRLFYSAQFDVAEEILCWQMGGNFLRVISWPMGFVLLAKGMGKTFVLTDFAAFAAYLGMSWVGLKWFGLPGMGMAFLGLYLFHVVMIATVVGKCSGFRWSPANVRRIFLGLGMVSVALFARITLGELPAIGIGAALAVVAGLFSLKALVTILGKEQVNELFKKFRLPFRLRE